MLDLLSQHVRFAARTLRRSPLFAIVSVLSIAIGVGATTAIVTLANTLLLRPPPGVGHPERVVTIGSTREGRGFDNFSYPNFIDYKTARSLSSVAAIRVDPQPVSLTLRGAAHRCDRVRRRRGAARAGGTRRQLDSGAPRIAGGPGHCAP